MCDSHKPTAKDRPAFFQFEAAAPCRARCTPGKPTLISNLRFQIPGERIPDTAPITVTSSPPGPSRGHIRLVFKAQINVPQRVTCENERNRFSKRTHLSVPLESLFSVTSVLSMARKPPRPLWLTAASSTTAPETPEFRSARSSLRWGAGQPWSLAPSRPRTIQGPAP